MDIYGLLSNRYDTTGMLDPIRHRCGAVYDLAAVEVVARYLDRSVWRCPGCKQQVDDRKDSGWSQHRSYEHLPRAVRNYYA